MTSVTYSSTRGGQKNLDFRTVVMQGLAHDKGLFVPDSIPVVSPAELEEWRSLPFADLACNVIAKFVQEDQVPAAELTDIIKRSCAAFRSHEVTPLVNVGGHAILVGKLLTVTLLKIRHIESTHCFSGSSLSSSHNSLFVQYQYQYQ